MFDKPVDFKTVKADFRELLKRDRQGFEITYWDGFIRVYLGGDAPNPISALGVRATLDAFDKRFKRVFVYEAPTGSKDRLDSREMSDLYFEFRNQEWGRFIYDRVIDGETQRLFWIGFTDAQEASDFAAKYDGKNKKPARAD